MTFWKNLVLLGEYFYKGIAPAVLFLVFSIVLNRHDLFYGSYLLLYIVFGILAMARIMRTTMIPKK